MLKTWGSVGAARAALLGQVTGDSGGMGRKRSQAVDAVRYPTAGGCHTCRSRDGSRFLEGLHRLLLLPRSARWGSCPPQAQCVPAGRTRRLETERHRTNREAETLSGLGAPSRDESKAGSLARPGIPQVPVFLQVPAFSQVPVFPHVLTSPQVPVKSQIPAPRAGPGLEMGLGSPGSVVGQSWVLSVETSDPEARKALRGQAPNTAPITCNKGQST